MFSDARYQTSLMLVCWHGSSSVESKLVRPARFAMMEGGHHLPVQTLVQGLSAQGVTNEVASSGETGPSLHSKEHAYAVGLLTGDTRSRRGQPPLRLCDCESLCCIKSSVMHAVQMRDLHPRQLANPDTPEPSVAVLSCALLRQSLSPRRPRPLPADSQNSALVSFLLGFARP